MVYHIIQCYCIKVGICPTKGGDLALRSSGVARNLSWGEQMRGDLGDRSPPAGSRGGAPVRGLGGPEADEFTTKIFRILIAR